MPNPVKVTLEVGKEYAWHCMEGHGLANESEQANGFVDHMFTADRTEAFICTCKQTKTPPFCDGSHKTVKDEEVGNS